MLEPAFREGSAMVEWGQGVGNIIKLIDRCVIKIRKLTYSKAGST